MEGLVRGGAGRLVLVGIFHSGSGGCGFLGFPLGFDLVVVVVDVNRIRFEELRRFEELADLVIVGSDL